MQTYHSNIVVPSASGEAAAYQQTNKRYAKKVLSPARCRSERAEQPPKLTPTHTFRRARFFSHLSCSHQNVNRLRGLGLSRSRSTHFTQPGLKRKARVGRGGKNPPYWNECFGTSKGKRKHTHIATTMTRTRFHLSSTGFRCTTQIFCQVAG